jgi:hypothetical protein
MTHPTPTATSALGGDPWSALHRPLHLPSVAPGANCPAATEHSLSTDFPNVLGDGPVYMQGLWSHGTYSIEGAASTQGYYALKVLWASRPDYTWPILIRGQQVDGTGLLRFGLNAQQLLAELELPTGSGGSATNGWGEWPSYTMLGAPGCYAYQVDGQTFSEVIVFRVIP